MTGSGQERSPATVGRQLRRVAGGLRRRAKRVGQGRWAPAHRIPQLPGQRRGAPQDGFALTFDDGPDPEVTPAILDVLADEDATAAFFMCGLNAQRHPEIVRAVAGAGHLIGGHTWDHRPLREMTEDDWALQIERTHSLLEELSGQRISYVRPPRGLMDRRCHRRLRAAGLTPVNASAVGRDWKETDPAAIAGWVGARLDAGGIVLLHDACGVLLPPGGRLSPGTHADRWPTVAATSRILAEARSAGLRPVPLPVPR